MLAEKERHKKYRKQDEEREVVRQSIRDKVGKCLLCCLYSIVCYLQYNLEKPVNDDDAEDEDDEDVSFGATKKKEE